MAKLDVDNYRIVFGMLDLDGGGNIEVDELQIGLKSIGRVYTDEQMQAMFDKVDEDKSGEIDFSEFLQFMLNLKDSADEASTDKPEANGEGNGNQDETSLEPDSPGGRKSPSSPSGRESPVSPGGRPPSRLTMLVSAPTPQRKVELAPIGSSAKIAPTQDEGPDNTLLENTVATAVVGAAETSDTPPGGSGENVGEGKNGADGQHSVQSPEP